MENKILTGPFARVLFVLPFLVFGLFNLMKAPQMVEMVPTWLPMGIMLVYLTGLIQVAGSLMILADVKGDLAAYALGFLALTYALVIHLPAMQNAASEMLKMASMTTLLMSLALAGGALVISTTMKRTHSMF